MHPSEADLPNENGLGSVDDAVFHVVGAGNAYEETVERLLQVINSSSSPTGKASKLGVGRAMCADDRRWLASVGLHACPEKNGIT